MYAPLMSRDTIRKTLALDPDIWKAIAHYRFDNRIPTEMEAVRRLILESLRAHNIPIDPPSNEIAP